MAAPAVLVAVEAVEMAVVGVLQKGLEEEETVGAPVDGAVVEGL